jgi:D-hexose-6-phosphate mutarotase
MTIDELQKRFGIAGLVRFEAGEAGLPRVVIAAEGGDAHVYLHGAHVTHYQPRGKEPALFLSRASHFTGDKPIRGGVPIIFPWFGAKEGGPAAPMHGFARVMQWDVIEAAILSDRSLRLALELISSDATRAAWPYDFQLRYSVVVGASDLTLSLEVTNTSATELRFEEALHTYLAVRDVRSVHVTGLAGKRYIDKVDHFQEKTQPAEIVINGETDRVYLDATEPIDVDDPALHRRISVGKEGSRSTVLWNPWIAKAKAMSDFGDDEWTQMLCVETANASINAITLPAGVAHTMRATLAVI